MPRKPAGMISTPLRATAYRGEPFLSTSTVTVVCPSGERTVAGCAAAVMATSRVANRIEARRTVDVIDGSPCLARGRPGPRPPLRPSIAASPEAAGSLAMNGLSSRGQRSMQTYARPCGPSGRDDSLRLTFRRSPDAQADALEMAVGARCRARCDHGGCGGPDRAGRAVV